MVCGSTALQTAVSRRVLERIKQSGDIFFAESDRPWVLDGASVRVSMVGFDNGSEEQRILDGAPARNIYADLSGSLDLSATKRLQQKTGIGFVADVKGGKFDIPGDLARSWLQLPPNPNGRPNSDVVRPWVNSLDITRRNRDMWIVDFGIDMPESEAALYEVPFEHVLQRVKPARANTNDKVARKL